MSIETLTLIHVLISLVGIASGFVAVYGLLTATPLRAWTATFLATTLATTLTGFLFPYERLLPSHIFGAITLVVLALAIPALYVFQLAGVWRRVYIIGALIALYLNVFVGVVQAFLKVPVLKALAPTGSEAPFAVTQLAVLAAFLYLGYMATVRTRPTAARAAA